MTDREAPAGLADLERDGFVLVRGALDAGTVAEWKHKLYDMHRRGLNEIDNSVGNVAFESLLQPTTPPPTPCRPSRSRWRTVPRAR